MSRGVSRTRAGTWLARVGGTRLGVYASEIEAAVACDRAARAIYGAAARLNFPDGEPSGVEPRRLERKWRPKASRALDRLNRLMVGPAIFDNWEAAWRRRVARADAKHLAALQRHHPRVTQ